MMIEKKAFHCVVFSLIHLTVYSLIEEKRGRETRKNKIKKKTIFRAELEPWSSKPKNKK